MFKGLKSLFVTERPSNASAASATGTVIAPDRDFVAVGDIHGCIELMEDKLARIRAATGGGVPVVFVGDYIDRGPRSAQVLRRLFDMQNENPEEIVCLKGNHELMMLNFIDDPAGLGLRWLKFGGRDTLKSFGIKALGKRLDFDDALEAANALEEALPEGMQSWLRNLPLTWSSGNMYCVHAAMDPARLPHEQTDETLLWGIDTFLAQPRDDDINVVHGHTIVRAPMISANRISIDTGAYDTGRLTAVGITAGNANFL